ncbi:hypothetical protein CROQUDRAFT_657296 [Cronartium quercuum f. sp. fusiforme G11]|uniref:Uncharacterized protein n=1 Tax=Cronartium quercuum f. sp. fusiforme G11 TaxID=708437 RepID=A0A9P6NI97_9BASI|nr:hypothetical protein CROQUDRAFT_657296 [Cronartium quercuum f. sp. fusiforme G11]
MVGLTILQNRRNFLRRARTHDSLLSNESFACHGLPNDEFPEYVAYASQPQPQSTRRHHNGFYDDYYAAPTPVAHQRFDFYKVPDTPKHVLERESSYDASENSRRAQRRKGRLFEDGYFPTTNINNPSSYTRRSGMTDLSNDIQRYISPSTRSHRSGSCPEVCDFGSQARRGYGRGAIDYNMVINDTDMQQGSSHAHRHAPYQANHLQQTVKRENNSAQQHEPLDSFNLADCRLSQICSADELGEIPGEGSQDYHQSTRFGTGRHGPENIFMDFGDTEEDPYYSIPDSASYQPLQQNYAYQFSSSRRNYPTYRSLHQTRFY